MFARKVVESPSSELGGLENPNINYHHRNVLNHTNVLIAPQLFGIINNPSTIYTKEMFASMCSEWTDNQAVFQSFTYRKVFFQRFHIFVESLLTSRGNFAGSVWHLSFEAFFHRDVPSSHKFVNLHTEISRRGTSLFLEVGKVGFIYSNQDGHHGQS